MAIIVPIAGIIFACARGCNKCGGRKISPDGYSNQNIYLHFGLFLIFGILLMQVNLIEIF
jgi:hypothetical protein